MSEGCVFKADEQLILERCESNLVAGAIVPIVQLIALIRRVAVIHPAQHLDVYQAAAAEILLDTIPSN
jgi:hypothetical protein